MATTGAIEAGGMFRALVADRESLVPELSDVRRFQNDWEKTASVELRVGHETAIDTYSSEGRVAGGSRAEMLDALYRAWKTDTETGVTSLMIALDSAMVAELNTRARTDRVGAGHVSPEGLDVAGGQSAGVGDLVITRQNNRRLAAGRRWVKNGDCWTVTATNPDGCMAVRRLGGNGQVVLPPDYVRAHVELGYATTTQRAQGRTVATAHAMVSPTTTREALYVAVTRGRDANLLYVDTNWDPDPQTSHDGTAAPHTAKEVLVGVLHNEGADLAAHDMIRRSQSEAESIARLFAEYQTIAKAAQADRWEALLEGCGLTTGQLAALRTSQAHGPLLAAFRNADARGLDIESTFPLLVAGRALDDAGDIASVLHRRVDRWVERAGSIRRARAEGMIVGLKPKAGGVSDPDMQQALAEREHAMEQRALTLAEQAIEAAQPWVRRLGTPPSDPTRRIGWLKEVCVIAAYRDRWSITGPTVIGRRDDTSSLEQLGQHKRAQASTSGHRPCPRPHEGSTADPGPERAVSSRQDRERSSIVISKRKQARELARWEADTRTWALHTARDLALALYYDRDTGSRPFRVGVVLAQGERVWVETPLCFSADLPTTAARTTTASPPQRSQPRPWLVTNHRIVARLGDDRLHGWRWEHMVGCRLDLAPGREILALDLDCRSPLVWTGPGVAPLAVAAVYRLHGPLAMIEHPGLALVRLQTAS